MTRLRFQAALVACQALIDGLDRDAIHAQRHIRKSFTRHLFIDLPLAQWSAVQLVHAIQSREVSATEAMHTCLTQIDQHNDRLKALITVCGDRALAEARAADEAISQGEI